MRLTLTLLLILILCGNGLLMLALPEPWYHLIPGVSATGPYNPHFIRDIGCAYLLCGLAYVWLLRQPGVARPAALGAALFLAMHAVVHLWDALAGRESLEHLIGDIPGVFLIPTLALWLVLSGRRTLST